MCSCRPNSTLLAHQTTEARIWQSSSLHCLQPCYSFLQQSRGHGGSPIYRALLAHAARGILQESWQLYIQTPGLIASALVVTSALHSFLRHYIIIIITIIC